MKMRKKETLFVRSFVVGVYCIMQTTFLLESQGLETVSFIRFVPTHSAGVKLKGMQGIL